MAPQPDSAREPGSSRKGLRELRPGQPLQATVSSSIDLAVATAYSPDP